MSAFKHFDTSPYLEGSKLEPQLRNPAKVAKVAKAVAGFAGFAGVPAESSNLEGVPAEQFGGAAAVASADPFNPEKQPKAAAGNLVPAPSAAPAEWATAAAQLQHTDRPATVGEERWQQVRSDAARLLDWVPMLEAMDWTPEDVFGRDDIDRQSLAWKVNAQRIGLITKIAAVLRGADGSTTWVYRRVDTATEPSNNGLKP